MTVLNSVLWLRPRLEVVMPRARLVSNRNWLFSNASLNSSLDLIRHSIKEGLCAVINGLLHMKSLCVVEFGNCSWHSGQMSG